MSDKYWAEVAARKAAGQKISVEDAMAGKVQMDLMRSMARGAGIEDQAAATASVRETPSRGDDDWLAPVLLVLIFAGFLLFYVLPSAFLSAIESGRVARAMMMGVAMASAYGGIGFAVWRVIKYFRKEKQEEDLRHAAAELRKAELATLVSSAIKERDALWEQFEKENDDWDEHRQEEFDARIDELAAIICEGAALGIKYE